AQVVPAFRRIAEREPLRDLGIEAASLEIRPRLRASGLGERLDVEARREVHGPEELFPPGLSRGALVRERDVGLLRQRAHGLGKRGLVLTNEKAERVTADPATEAVEDSLLRIDHERRRLLAVEGTQALPVHAGLLEVHEPADEVHDVDPRADLVEQGGGK